MAGCCLTNLGCLSIPIIETSVSGPSGPAGRGISSESYDPANGELTLSFTDFTTYTTGDLRGAAGSNGSNGTDGAPGISRLYTNFSPSTSTTVQSWQQMNTYTLAANSLVNIGDSIIIQFEVELLKKNLVIPIFGQTTILSPRRRISIASGTTSITRFDTSDALGEPTMTTVSLSKGGTQTFLYRTTVELTKTAASAVAGNFKSRVRWDGGVTPASVYTHNSISAFNITVANPIVFSLDIYQFQTAEIGTVSLTIDKLTAEV